MHFVFVYFIQQYVSKNVISSEHVIERETETSFSTSHYTSTTHHSTTVTQTPSHRFVCFLFTIHEHIFKTPYRPETSNCEKQVQGNDTTLETIKVDVKP